MLSTPEPSRNGTFGYTTCSSRLASTAEAEIIALSEAAKEVVYFRKFLRGVNKSYIAGPTRLETDSKAAFDLSYNPCLLYTSPSPRDKRQSRMPSSA